MYIYIFIPSLLRYTYYFVSMHTDQIWWKKHLTKMQLMQFCMMIGQASWLLLSSCRTYLISAFYTIKRRPPGRL